MAWENPVTTWGQAGKTVPGAGDFNRIEGNILHLQDTKETPAGAQAKAGAVQAELNTHKADGASHSKTARFVIGTSTAGWTAADCDYLCDGTNDQEEIIQALNALPATGGEVVILDGTYNIKASINIPKDNVSIRGSGNATTLKRRYNSTETDSGATARGLITLNGKSGCKIQGLQIDGNKATYTASYNYGIYLNSSSNNTVTGNTCNNNSYSIRLNSSSNNTVTGNTCNNNSNYGISISSSSSDNTVTGNTCNNNSNYGIYLNSSSNNAVTVNTCNNNSNGIYLTSSSNNNIITGNTCNNNSNGIYLTSSSNNNIITGNTCNNSSYGIYLTSSSNNTVTGNACNNSNYGIYLYSSSNNTITGNPCNNNNNGIYLTSSSNNNIITGNTCIRGTGQPSDYTSSQYTIRLSGSSNSYNLISSNNCMGKAPVVEGGTGNTLVNNKWNAS
jgi:parallel beta-helix repeat protein